jgi:hypothetical protein
MHSPPTRLELENFARSRLRLIRKMRAMPMLCGNVEFS